MSRHNFRYRNFFILSDCRGFSLLELLVVVGILASISFISLGGYAKVLDDSNDRLARTEMQQIAKALAQFKADTGYYPKTGPFGLADCVDSGQVVDDGLPEYIQAIEATGSDSIVDQKCRWFYSPANLYQLTAVTSPLTGSGSPLKTWDPETGRGWRGPYLKGFKDGYVDISDSINGTDDDELAQGDIEGTPLDDSSEDYDIPDVIGVADPFEFGEKEAGGSGVDDTLLDWSLYRRRLSDESDDPDDDDYYEGRENGTRSRWGRPYLVFGLDQTDMDIGGAKNPGPVIISMGPNGEFDHGEYDPDNNTDDILLYVK